MADSSKVMKMVQSVINVGLNGAGGLSSAQELADEYRANYSTVDEAIEALIKWESRKSFGTGFVTGLGGLITLPVAIPSALFASWTVQARLVGAVAELKGLSSRDARVQTMVLLIMLGDGMKEALKQAGVEVSKRVSLQVIKQVPGHALREINKQVGFRLVTKAGEKGVVNLTKVVPLLGGLVGGGIDAYATRKVGKMAHKTLSA